MPSIKRDLSDEIGYHFRLDLEDELTGAVEVDAFRIHSEGQVFLEVWGNRGSDSQFDSVVIALPLSIVGAVTQALAGAARHLHKKGTK